MPLISIVTPCYNKEPNRRVGTACAHDHGHNVPSTTTSIFSSTMLLATIRSASSANTLPQFTQVLKRPLVVERERINFETNAVKPKSLSEAVGHLTP
jgi:hypothetical protein